MKTTIIAVVMIVLAIGGSFALSGCGGSDTASVKVPVVSVK